MEDFEGIFIATTNRADNLDSAFERRFLYKIHLKLPDADTRRKIWSSLIPELTRDEVKKLATKYQFSGGQISNIATRFDIDVALLDKQPSFNEIISYCETELIEQGATGKTNTPTQVREFGMEHKVLS